MAEGHPERGHRRSASQASAGTSSTIDGHDLDADPEAFEKAKADDNGRPKLIIARTLIGKGIPEVAGTAKGHGEGGAKFAESRAQGTRPSRRRHFYVSDEVRTYFADTQGAPRSSRYDELAEDLRRVAPRRNPELAEAAAGSRRSPGRFPPTCCEKIPAFAADYDDATRGAGGAVHQRDRQGDAAAHHRQRRPVRLDQELHQGRAATSAATTATGRNIWFGIREHAMGAICNGIAYDGIFRAIGATFLVFADYCARRSASPRCRDCPSPTSSPTTPSVSARTARPTSRWRPSAACA